MNLYDVGQNPTPDFTTERICRVFNLPNSTLALSAFMGALWGLADPKSWQPYGDMTPDEAAEMIQDILWEVMLGEELECITVPSPYWDLPSGDDTDDTSSGDTQVWYGELVETPSLLAGDDLTFVENVKLWIVTGAFLLLTRDIGATIAFHPLARRMFLEFRNHNLGGIVRVFVDAAMVGQIDTYSPSASVSQFAVFMPDDGEDHTLWVSMAEETNPAVTEGANIQVIRKRLDEGEVYPTTIRYVPETNKVQTDPSGTGDWQDTPTADPRISDASRFPPVGGSDPKCQAAANMTRYFENLIGETLSVLGFGLDALGVATSLMPLFVELGGFAIFFDLAFGLATSLIGLGVDTINAEFTPEVYDALQCVFYCLIEDDGSVTEADLNGINAAIGADFSADVYLIMGACFLLMGQVGLSNAGTLGDAPADCSACDCPDKCHEWSGVGSTSLDALYTYRNFASSLSPSVQFTRITVQWQLNPNSGAVLQNAYLYLNFNGARYDTVGITTTTGEKVWEFPAADAQGSFDLGLASYYSGGSNYPDFVLIRFEYLPNPAIGWVGGSAC